MSFNNPQTIENSHFNHNEAQKNQLNNSSSKMKYSFPKTKRFSYGQRSSGPDAFYQIPTIKNNRSTSLGYGNKLDLSKINSYAPPSNTYIIKRQFDEFDRKKGFSIAKGRSDVKNNDMFYQPLKKCANPFSYKPCHNFMSKSYSIHAKIQDNTQKWIKSVPSPNQYLCNVIDLTNKSPISKYITPPSSSFSKVIRLSQAQLRNKNRPLPQISNHMQLLLEGDLNELTDKLKFQNKNGSSFSRSARQGIINKNSFKIPGPGAYDHFNAF